MLQESAGEREELQNYLNRSDARRQYRRAQASGLCSRASLARRYTSFDAVITSVRVLQLAEKFQSRVVVRYARDVTLRDISPGNAVLVGRPATNLWTGLFESKTQLPR